MAYTFRKGINFAHKLDKYYRKERLFLYVRRSAVALTVITTFTAAVLIFLNLKVSISTRNLTIERKKLLDALLEKSAENEKLFVLADKIQFARKLLEKEDVRFLVYYKAVNDVIKEISDESTSSANVQIKKFVLDKNRTVNFEITTEDAAGYLKLLDSIDNPKFLKLFEELSLASFNITKSSTTNLYTLQFKGKFKKLDEKEN